MFIAAWIVLAIGAGAVANAKGRDTFGYFILGLILPLIGFLIAACMPSKYYVNAYGEQQLIKEQTSHGSQLLAIFILILLVVGGAIAMHP